jgi:hypothetical protein
MSPVALTFAVFAGRFAVKATGDCFEAEESPKKLIFPVQISRPGAIFQ